LQVTVPTTDNPGGPEPDADDSAVVRTFLQHDNHDPYSVEEVKHLPTHPTALAFAEEELVSWVSLIQSQCSLLSLQESLKGGVPHVVHAVLLEVLCGLTRADVRHENWALFF
jgi:hypothetical protein